MPREFYIGWVAFYEGQGDSADFDVLLPRLMEEITAAERARAVAVPQTPALHLEAGRDRERVAAKLCKNAESFSLIFIHADTGGRAQEASMDDRGAAYCRAVQDLCGWPPERCVVLQPRHETEAWVLADPEAVMEALGLRGDPSRYGLPPNAAAAEALPEAKGTLNDIVRGVVGRRKPRRGSTALFARVAQTQRLDALRGSRSFRTFEADLRRALVSLGCLPRQN